ncbi:MAG: isochorismatase family protein [Christensenellales bacterium]|jgi:nicotinamidase-related amidase
MRILAEETLALAIDFQERLMPVIDDAQELVKKTQILLKGLAMQHIPGLISEQYPKGLGDTIPELAECTHWPSLEKTSFSCAMCPEMLEKIRSYGRKNVVICGVEAHICVLQTIVDLIAQGFCVVLIADCVGSRNPRDAEIAIARARQEGAVVTSCESLLFELAVRKENPCFKELSKLIK